MGEFASELVALLGRLASPLFGPIRWVWILVHDRPDVRITFETYTPRAGGPPSYYAELVNHGPRQVELARAGYSYGDRKLKEQSFMLEVETNRVGTTRGERRRGLPVELGYRQAAQAALHVEHLVDDTGRVARELFYEDWTRATYWARLPDGLRDLAERYRDDPDRPRKYVDEHGQPVMRKPSEAGDLEPWRDEA